MGIGRGKFFDWRVRYGKANEHNGVPRDHWLEDDEEWRIVEFHDRHPLEGYRRLTIMMIDQDMMAASPSTVYRVLVRAGRLTRWIRKLSRKGTGLMQPLAPHEHWHVDVSYLNIASTFFHLCSVLDGASRAVVHWDLRESMKEPDVELILERAREKYPGVKPRIISDNGPQFIARDFKEYIRLTGMTHVRTAPFYPQSKIERWHKTIKADRIRPAAPQTRGEGLRVVSRGRAFCWWADDDRLLDTGRLRAGDMDTVLATRPGSLARSPSRAEPTSTPSPFTSPVFPRLAVGHAAGPRCHRRNRLLRQGSGKANVETLPWASSRPPRRPHGSRRLRCEVDFAASDPARVERLPHASSELLQDRQELGTAWCWKRCGG